MIVIFSNPEGLSVSVNVEAIRSTEESLFLADLEEEFIINRDELKQIFTDYDVFNYSDGITLTQFKQDFLRESVSNMPKTNSTLQWTLGDVKEEHKSYILTLTNDMTSFFLKHSPVGEYYVEIFHSNKSNKLVINHNFTQPRIIDKIGATLYVCGN